jgi:hypothetical protein
VGAASSREIKGSRLEAAPTTNIACSFRITAKAFYGLADLANYLVLTILSGRIKQ